MREAIHEVAPTVHVTELPLADGGEGTLDCLVAATGGKKCAATVMDPLGRDITAHYGVLGDGRTAVIELAQASGLLLLAESERNPLLTSTYGTGQLVKAAIEDGYRQVIIGLGGSATNDGGVGLLRALGIKFYDAHGQELADGGAALRQLQQIDVTGLHPLLKECAFIIASDVENLLYGVNGASAIFGPQKGATREMVKQLDAALMHFAGCVTQQFGIDLQSFVGGGAAGGVGATLQAFLQTEYRSGIDVVMEATKAKTAIKRANLVMTGEGKLDTQTLAGKVIAGVTRCASTSHVPVIALAGTVELTATQLGQLGVTAAFSIVPGPCTLQEATMHAPCWLAARTRQVMQLYLQAKGEIT